MADDIAHHSRDSRVASNEAAFVIVESMGDPERTVSCERHGTSEATFICGHLAGAVGAGFFTAEDADGVARPDAWCARCDEVLQAEREWHDTSEGFAHIRLACAGCYDEIRAHNEWKQLDTEQDRFTCSDCGEVHQGLPLDFATDTPALSSEDLSQAKFTDDRCEFGEHRFIRSCLEIPIIGGPGPLVYGVWVTLSQQSYAEYVHHLSEPRRFLDGPYFGWFASALPQWPDTVQLKVRVHVRPPPRRPVIELEPTDHPLAGAQREGISLARFQELALAHLHR
ncbi:MAG: DUF2199 domain-containing protein [Archangium sp.]|nr:DUF2199 domain-containing protein [Archangium sp.]